MPLAQKKKAAEKRRTPKRKRRKSAALQNVYALLGQDGSALFFMNDFAKHLDEQIARYAEPGRHRVICRDKLLDELCAIGSDVAIPLLVAQLGNPDGERRCIAAELILRLERQKGIKYVLPLFHDELDFVRWHVIGMMDSVGNETTIEPLIERLQNDPDPGVRNTAAYALGRIGNLTAIPALIQAMDNDLELDSQGHSASSCSATALDNIVGTNHTRIKVAENLCTLAPWPPDLEALKKKALDLYASWHVQGDT